MKKLSGLPALNHRDRIITESHLTIVFCKIRSDRHILVREYTSTSISFTKISSETVYHYSSKIITT